MAEEHSSAEVREDLVRALREYEGRTVVITYRYWEGDAFAVATKEGDLLQVDTVWPAAFLRSAATGASRVPLHYIVSVTTPDGALIWQQA